MKDFMETILKEMDMFENKEEIKKKISGGQSIKNNSSPKKAGENSKSLLKHSESSKAVCWEEPFEYLMTQVSTRIQTCKEAAIRQKEIAEKIKNQQQAGDYKWIETLEKVKSIDTRCNFLIFNMHVVKLAEDRYSKKNFEKTLIGSATSQIGFN